MTLKALFVQGRGTGRRAQNWQIWLPWLIVFSTVCYHSDWKPRIIGSYDGAVTLLNTAFPSISFSTQLHTCACSHPSSGPEKSSSPSIPARSQLLSRVVLKVGAAAGWALSQGKPLLPIPAAPERWGRTPLKPVWARSKPCKGLLPRSGEVQALEGAQEQVWHGNVGVCVPSELPGTLQHVHCASSQQWAGLGTKWKLLLDKLFK